MEFLKLMVCVNVRIEIPALKFSGLSINPAMWENWEFLGGSV